MVFVSNNEIIITRSGEKEIMSEENKKMVELTEDEMKKASGGYCDEYDPDDYGPATMQRLFGEYELKK